MSRQLVVLQQRELEKQHRNKLKNRFKEKECRYSF